MTFSMFLVIILLISEQMAKIHPNQVYPGIDNQNLYDHKQLVSGLKFWLWILSDNSDNIHTDGFMYHMVVNK